MPACHWTSVRGGTDIYLTQTERFYLLNHPHTYMHLDIHASIHPSIRRHTDLSIHAYIHSASTHHPSIHILTAPSTHLSIYPSVHLSTRLPVLKIYLPLAFSTSILPNKPMTQHQPVSLYLLPGLLLCIQVVC